MLWHLRAHHISPVMRKPAFCICKNKNADQLGSNREADQRLRFRICKKYILPKSEFQVSSHFLWLYSPVCVRLGRGLGSVCVCVGGLICHILFYGIIMIGPLHDKTSNFCLQLIIHKAKFNVYSHELENDHIHKKAKQIST